MPELRGAAPAASAAAPPPPARESRRAARARWTTSRSARSSARSATRASPRRQLNVIQQAATRNYFRVGQLKGLIDLLSFSATKLRALELGAPRIVDPENAFAIYDAFTFSADKEQARQILRRNGL